MELATLPEHVIVDSTEYKCLQSQFSVLYNESMQMRTQLEQVRGLLHQSKTQHLRQIEGRLLGCDLEVKVAINRSFGASIRVTERL